MKIKIGYLAIDLVFEDMECFGEWHEPDTIYIKEDLSGPLLVDTINHEINHVGYWLYQPSDEESQVRVCSTIWTEALSRNKNLRELVYANIG